MKKPISRRTIKYIDSARDTSQTNILLEPVEITVVGYVVNETPDYITLAMEILSTQYGKEYRSQLAIPKAAILK